ncbi:MAG: FAD-dependent oxidoreductase, partial [Anaerolineales bacterium]|nr:FAD-dependent oxidoreductase [Anaerolineales bacterium]
FPRMSPDERQDVLRRFHPDYIEQAMREIRIGRSKGARTPLEMADVLEAPPQIDPAAFHLGAPDLVCDVLVIGGGGAGASAALLASENGSQVVLATKLRFGDANTMMAQGGIQAADKPDDSPAIHYLDVVGGGHYTNVPDLVEAMVTDAPSVIRWLEELGVMFDKLPDGTMNTVHGGGTSRKRMHSARDYSGAEIMRVLRDEVRSRADRIQALEFNPAVELLTDAAGRVTGAVLLDLETREYRVIGAKAVVLATGGGGRLHYQGFPTTNHYGATGDGVVLAYRAGAHLAFMHTMQYHPTGAAFPEQILGQLVTEKVRGLGAQVCNVHGEQFVYPLETRDVEAAAFIRECSERGNGVAAHTGQLGVWLDSPMIDLTHGPGTIERGLPAMVRQFKNFGIDMTRQPILVYPTLHFQNGGVAHDAHGATGVPGLFSAGEVCGGVHGENRLMGNSLLEITVYGRRTGRAAAAYSHSVELGERTLQHLQAWEQERSQSGLSGGRPSPILLPDYTRHARPVREAPLIPVSAGQ